MLVQRKKMAIVGVGRFVWGLLSTFVFWCSVSVMSSALSVSVHVGSWGLDVGSMLWCSVCVKTFTKFVNMNCRMCMLCCMSYPLGYFHAYDRRVSWPSCWDSYLNHLYNFYG